MTPRKLGDKQVYALSRLAEDATLNLGEAAGDYAVAPGKRVLVIRGGVLGPLVVCEDVFGALPEEVQRGLFSEHLFLDESEIDERGRLLIGERIREAYGLRCGDEVLLASAGNRGLHLILRGGLFGRAQGTPTLPRLR
ncbi:MAG: hypothetical protein GF403_09685 [Candidatus Coatesbacteria bacterium]|nr:hypothetical protein [Candidatus Coatesbacteria bacterium]